MNTWSWPQYVLALFILFGFVHFVIKTGLDRSISSGQATLRMLIYAGLCAVHAYVLHAGGFW